MKELLLLRHAKSSWDDPQLDDFDRPLAERGRRAAPVMGKEIARRGWSPDHVMVSPALRTRQTWELVSAELPDSTDAVFRSQIYTDSADDLLGLLRGAPESAARILLLGHNPALERFADRLAGAGSDKDALNRMRRKFPTAGLARFVVTGPWRNLALGGAEFADFLIPKELVP
ncbi:MAG TPA: histidine phosphatase family protein [Rhizobiaceae bacterium]|nr:histidine phosphatase family protein [Rhizobiaceae bacterium]